MMVWNQFIDLQQPEAWITQFGYAAEAAVVTMLFHAVML